MRRDSEEDSMVRDKELRLLRMVSLALEDTHDDMKAA